MILANSLSLDTWYLPCLIPCMSIRGISGLPCLYYANLYNLPALPIPCDAIHGNLFSLNYFLLFRQLKLINILMED